MSNFFAVVLNISKAVRVDNEVFLAEAWKSFI